MKGKPRQLQDNRYKPNIKSVDDFIYDAAKSGLTAIRDKALETFDSLNKNNVPLPDIPPPNLGSLGGGSNTGTNTGSNGNSG